MKVQSRLIAAAVAGAMTLSLSACGRDAGNSGGENSGDPGKSSAAGSDIASGPATGSLDVWAMGVEGEKLPELVKKFEDENPDVTINVTAVPWESAHDKFTAAIAAGTTPDVAQVGTTWMGEFVGLDALDATPGLIDADQFFEGAQATTMVDGTSYAVPWYVETRLVYYRTDIAKAAGITDVPKDWDALKDMANKMQQQDGVDWGINLQPGGTGSWQTVLPLMWSNGGAVTDDDVTKFTFNTPENAEALAYYQSFFSEKIANSAPTEGMTETQFADGSVPMFISGPWMMGSVEAAGGEGFADKYDVFEMPVKKSSASFIGGSNLAVFKASDNRDAAWKLVEYLTDAQTQVSWFEISTDLPAVQSAWEDDALQADEKLAKFGTQLESAFAPPSISTWEQVADQLDGEVEKVTKTGADPAEALANVQKQATSIGMG